jgi:hypothetical protein
MAFMSQEQNEIAWNRIVGRYGKPACPICKSGEWQARETVSQIVGFPPQLATKGVLRQLESTTTPMAPVVCLTCGHVLWFDYLIAVVKNG